MGDNMSTVENKHILDRVELFDVREDYFFGKINIFRLKEPPYEYLFDYRKNYVNEPHRMNKDLELMQRVKKITHPNLAKIYHSELR